MGPIVSYKYTRSLTRGYFNFNLLMWLFFLLLFPLFIGSVLIVFFIWYVFSALCIFVYLEKNIKGLDILWYSKALVQKNKKIFLYELIILLISFFIEFIGRGKNIQLALIIQGLNLIAVPFLISIWYEIYKEIDQPVEIKSSRNWFIAGIIGWVIIIIILLMGAVFLKGNVKPFFTKIKEKPALEVVATPIPIPSPTPIPRTSIYYNLDTIPENTNAPGVEIVPGKINNAISFNGQNYSKITIENSKLSTIKEELTLSLWVKQLGKKGSPLIWISDSYKNGFGILVGDHGQIYCRTVDGVSGRTIDSSTGDKNIYLSMDSKWHYISVVMESNHCSIYINGEIKTSDWGIHDNLGVTNFNYVTLGGDPSEGQTFKGYLDEVKIYNYVQTQEEIKQNMAVSQTLTF